MHPAQKTNENVFNFLKPEIRQCLIDQGWVEPRNIQFQAIPKIITTHDDYILIARTASGKTEAAFLPAISLIENWQNGVKILYISPLRALINDQFIRIGQLCQLSGIKTFKWHSDAKQSDKEKLVKNPQGILLITPESIESMFCHRPESLGSLFGNLRFVIVDEVHTFLNTDRGRHLQSLLSRLRLFNKQHTRFMGLSATLSSDSQASAQNFYDRERPARIIASNSRNGLEKSIDYIEQTEQDKQANRSVNSLLIRSIFKKTQSGKA